MARIRRGDVLGFEVHLHSVYGMKALRITNNPAGMKPRIIFKHAVKMAGESKAIDFTTFAHHDGKCSLKSQAVEECTLSVIPSSSPFLVLNSTGFLIVLSLGRSYSNHLLSTYQRQTCLLYCLLQMGLMSILERVFPICSI